jgi:hypothetical protein
MEDKKSRAVDNTSESSSGNIMLYAFWGIMGITLIGIVGYLIYSIFLLNNDYYLMQTSDDSNSHSEVFLFIIYIQNAYNKCI